MKKPVEIPKTQEDATDYVGYRVLVIIGGILGLFFLLPFEPISYFVIGAILVPLTWWKTGKTLKARMSVTGCTTKQEWKAYVATLPKKPKKQKQASPARNKPAYSTPAKKKQWIATRPEALKYPRYPLLARGYANIEVVGEAFREQSVISALGGLVPEIEKTLDDVESFLIPEPENPYDKNAIMVWMNGHHVGYLSKEDAKEYASVIGSVSKQGYLPATSGRIWGVSRYNYEGKLRHHLYARVALSEPSLLLPSNDPPESPYSFLPWGPAIQVTKESDFLAELTEHLKGPDSYAIATLQPAERSLKNGALRQYVTVHMDHDQIGELTPNMSEKVLPAILHLKDLGFQTAVWARVKGTPLAIEVTLQMTKAHELPNDWFNNLPVTVPSLIRGSSSKQPAGQDNKPLIPVREEDWDF